LVKTAEISRSSSCRSAASMATSTKAAPAPLMAWPRRCHLLWAKFHATSITRSDHTCRHVTEIAAVSTVNADPHAPRHKTQTASGGNAS
jgi:hypothetical protein